MSNKIYPWTKTKFLGKNQYFDKDNMIIPNVCPTTIYFCHPKTLKCYSYKLLEYRRDIFKRPIYDWKKQLMIS